VQGVVFTSVCNCQGTEVMNHINTLKNT
jgi:hypothetical protein